MGEYEGYYEDLVVWLVSNHAHKDSKKPVFEVKKGVSNGLDYDEVEEVIIEADDEFGFLEHENDRVYLKQNRALLKYIDEETGEELKFLSTYLSHVTPPKLRDEFGLPPPHG